MQIVIDIPEEIYAECKRDIYFPDTGGELFDAVRNGTPLPKNHGRLIDADALEKDTNYSNYDGYYHAYSSNAIYHAPTIIEAEGSESE